MNVIRRRHRRRRRRRFKVGFVYYLLRVTFFLLCYVLACIQIPCSIHIKRAFYMCASDFFLLVCRSIAFSYGPI